MATFDETQITSLAEIFGVASDYMSGFLTARESLITDSDKTSITARMTAYQAIESDNVDILARERNFGAQINADKKRSLIKQKIAALIGWEVSTSASLVRG